jgi:hypothetical protein
MPTRALVRYMVHRCGVTTPNFRWFAGTLGAAPRLEDAREFVAQQRYAGGPLGLWAIERGGRWLLVGVVAERSVELTPLGMDASAGQVTFEGKVGRRDWLVAYVAKGEAGFDTCDVDPIAPGRFRATCPVDRNDPGAYIDISAAPPGRLLGQLEARLWVSPDGSLSSSFEDPTRGARPTPIRATLEQDFVSAVNELRASAGSVPLTISNEQSRMVARLRPHYRDASTNGDGRRLDDIALGLLAGWAIPEPILSGAFSALEFETLGGREHLLEAALSQPGLRAALLDPDMSRIAIAIDPGKTCGVPSATPSMCSTVTSSRSWSWGSSGPWPPWRPERGRREATPRARECRSAGTSRTRRRRTRANHRLARPACESSACATTWWAARIGRESALVVIARRAARTPERHQQRRHEGELVDDAPAKPPRRDHRARIDLL